MTTNKFYRIPANSSSPVEALRKDWPRMIHVNGNGTQTGERSFATAWAEDRFPSGVASNEICHYARLPSSFLLTEGKAISVPKDFTEAQKQSLRSYVSLCGFTPVDVLVDENEDVVATAAGGSKVLSDFSNGFLAHFVVPLLDFSSTRVVTVGKLRRVSGQAVLDAYAAFLLTGEGQAAAGGLE